MKTSSSGNFRSIVGKVMMGLVLALMIVSIGVAPAFGKNDFKQRGKHDNRRYEQKGRYYEHGRRDYRPHGYGYRERVYVAPPVVYAPPPPPGIGIFFPPIFIPIR